jgi:hypothetical protein
VSVVPPGVAESLFLLVLAALLPVLALVARKSRRLQKYWEIPFAFFIFTGLLIGIPGFLVFYFLAAFGLSQRFFPNNGISMSRFFALRSSTAGAWPSFSSSR